MPSALCAIGLSATLAAASAGPETLSSADRMAILRLVCEGKLVRDRKGWVCKDPDPDEDSMLSIRLGELRWGTALRGRFVSGDGEWLIGLHGTCMQGCVGEAHVVRKVGTRWTVLAQAEQLVDERCVLLRGMAVGLDGVVCEWSAGPHQGGTFTALESLSFAGAEVGRRRLMETEQGGECFVGGAPPTTRSRDDQLGRPVPGDAASEVAFKVELERRTGTCDEDSKEPVRTEGRHVLRFLKRGGIIVPDEETARLLREHGWAPAP